MSDRALAVLIIATNTAIVWTWLGYGVWRRLRQLDDLAVTRFHTELNELSMRSLGLQLDDATKRAAWLEHGCKALRSEDDTARRLGKMVMENAGDKGPALVLADRLEEIGETEDAKWWREWGKP